MASANQNSLLLTMNQVKRNQAKLRLLARWNL